MIDGKLLLKPREAAKALSLSEPTLRGLVQAGEIHRVIVGRAIRYSTAQLQAWIQRRLSADSPRNASHGAHTLNPFGFSQCFLSWFDS